MSRHRTTLKMHRARDKEAPAQPTTTVEDQPTGGAQAQTAIDSEPPSLPTAEAAAAEAKPDVLTRESFNRYLAVEAEEREASLQRTSVFLSRYFKLTLAMACLNMVVAGVSVALLFSFSSNLKTVVVTAAAATPVVAAPAPAPVPVAAPVAPASAAPVMPETVPPAASPPPAAPVKLQLLGEPRPAAAKHSATAQRLPHPGVKPAPARSRTIEADDDESPTLASRTTERW
jgi:hypothetical protein